MAEPEALDHFGSFVTEFLRDGTIQHFDDLASGRWKAPVLKRLQADLAELPESARAVARRAVISAVDAAIHDFLFKLQEQADFENRIIVQVDGVNVVEISDGLHGEPYGEDGWYSRFSTFGEPPEQP